MQIIEGTTQGSDFLATASWASRILCQQAFAAEVGFATDAAVAKRE